MPQSWITRRFMAAMMTMPIWYALPSRAETATAPATPRTVAESSNFTATATHDQVMTMCRELAQSPRVRLTSLGTSHERRDLPLLILSQDGVTKPADLTDDARLVVFAMGNIHAGEVCGKEALLMLAREMTQGEIGPLEELVVLFAPIYNADGNERFAIDNRGNQVGPEKGMGQRPNAQGLDLNRDNIKHESPAAIALAKLISDWKPAVCIDLHTTNGSHHRYTITYDGPRHPATPGKIADFARDTFLPAVGRELAKSDYRSFFYGNFNKAHDQWDTYPDLPRYCTHYFGFRGTIGVLSEAYAYASYKDRVLATRDFVRSCLATTVNRQEAIRRTLQEALDADMAATEFAIQSIAVPYREFDVLGYVEEEQGGKNIATDREKTYRLVYHGLQRPSKTVKRPFAYLVPAGFEQVVENLTSHNIRLSQLTVATELAVETYRITDADMAEQEFQGHRTISVRSTASTITKQTYPAGTRLVRTHQPMLGGLIVNLLEPAATDGLCAWNFFDGQITQNGHMIKEAQFPIPRILNDVSEKLIDLP